MDELTDKVVVVTGAGTGVGRGHAVTLADYGAAVVVNDMGLASSDDRARPADRVVDVINQRGGRATADYTDVSSWDGAEALIATALDSFGQLDGLVNNAGVLLNASFLDADEAQFDATFGVHVKGTLACTQHALRHWQNMRERGLRVEASIVNTVSDALFLGLGDPIYGAAKAAVAHLTELGSVECSELGVRMNAIAPRAATKMSRSASLMEYPDEIPALEADEYQEDSPMNPWNPSPLVAWLLSDRSSHVTGKLFRTLAGAFAVCEPWSIGDLNWPPDGRMRFAFDEVDHVVNARILRSRFESGRLDFAPGDPRSQR